MPYKKIDGNNGAGASFAGVLGTIEVGDIGSEAGSLTVTGNITSASKTNVDIVSDLVTVVFPEVLNPRVFISIKSNSVPVGDNRIYPIVWDSLTSTSVRIFCEELINSGVNLTLHLMVISE